ncbi:MAG: TolC family protein [candidate division Zixibacteria bacterium]|nr:TolC family protein [candidate division Zixibacteria bacterium]
MIKSIFAVFMLLLPISAYGTDDILNKFIDEAIENNLALKQQDFSLQKSLAALHEARGLFLPSIDVIARYSKAGGGRSIDFPIGDIINPIHQSLNQILQEARFPGDLENINSPFMLEKEHDTKIQITQPVFQPLIYYNYKIKSNLCDIEKLSKKAFTRQLAADVKTAYFNYLKTVQVVQLYEKTEALLNENLRVCEKLFENQKVTKEAVFRAKAELSELEQGKSEAIKNRDMAAAYFNFLLNRPLNNAIEIISSDQLSADNKPEFTKAESLAVANRDEIKQMQTAIKAANNGAKLSKTKFLPGVSFIFDYGFQGEEYSFTSDDDFWMASMVLQWNLFNGLQDKSKVNQCQAEKRKLQAQLKELEIQVMLEVRNAYLNMDAANKSIIAANDRQNSARKSFEIVNKKFQQGMSPQIEFLDARSAMTRAEISYIIVQYDYHIRYAELEKALALYPVD